MSDTNANATQVGYRWWTAAENDDTGTVVIGPLDAAHVALARDAADYAGIEFAGCRGTNQTQVVLLDADNEPVAVIQDEEAPCQDGSLPSSDDLPVVDEADLDCDEGELELDDVLPYEGTIWDGNNHVVVNATRARAYVADTEREECDGHVTWVYDDYGDGDGESLVAMRIDDGWEQADFYATNGYGNESSRYEVEDVATEDEITRRRTWTPRVREALELAGVECEFSLITDGASNEPAEAWVFIVKTETLRGRTVEEIIEADGE